MAKGSSFERKICKLLSTWWSGGKHDDIFWRSSNSGARATVRGKSGRRTSGQCGDIAAIDPSGHALLRVVTIELKRGYSKLSVADLLDRSARSKPTGFEEFMEQAATSAKLAGTPHWLLVQRRDGRQEVVFFPLALRVALADECGLGNGTRLMLRAGPACAACVRGMVVVGMPLAEFLEWAHPKAFKVLANRINP